MASKDIRDILKDKPEGNDLFNKTEAIKKEAIPFLERIIITFPEYTPHNIAHSEIIIKKINDVIPDTLKEALNSYEIYFLIASAGRESVIGCY